MSHAVANYEPRPQMPLTLRPVTTPGNNPLGWARQEKVWKERHQAGYVAGRPSASKVVWPGCKFAFFEYNDVADHSQQISMAPISMSAVFAH